MQDLQRYFFAVSWRFSIDVPADREISCIYSHKRTKAASLRVSVDEGVSSMQEPGSQNPPVSAVSTQQSLCNDRDYVSPGTTDNRAVERALRRETGSDADMIAAINQQTSGTEYYGQSSNFVLLNQLLSQARNRLLAGSPDFSSNLAAQSQSSPAHPQVEQSPSLTVDSSPAGETRPNDPSQTPLSVVNLLCDESATLPDPRPKSPVTVAGRAQKARTLIAASRVEATTQERTGHSETSSPFGNAHVVANNTSDCFFGNPMLLEKEYVNQYFQNLHCIHPFLSPNNFKSRSESEIWSSSALKRLRRKQMHFLSLYNSVLAVGALIAPTDALRSLRAELEIRSEEDRQKGPKYIPSSIRLSKLYFQRARRLLGDVFEVCSLEGVQSLLLLVSRISHLVNNILLKISCSQYTVSML